MQKLSLHIFVNLTVGHEARCVVDFQHPRFQFGIEHDVEPEQLEAAVRFFWLTGAVDVLKLWLGRQNSLDHHRFNILPEVLA